MFAAILNYTKDEGPPFQTQMWLRDWFSSVANGLVTMKRLKTPFQTLTVHLKFFFRSFKENVHQLQASCNTQSSQQLRAEKDT